MNLAFVLQAEGKFQEAWNELTSALQRDKRYVPALEARAIVCLQMGNLFESFTDLTAAIDVSVIIIYTCGDSSTAKALLEGLRASKRDLNQVSKYMTLSFYHTCFRDPGAGNLWLVAMMPCMMCGYRGSLL